MRRGRRHANGDLVVISAPKRENPRKSGDLSAPEMAGKREGESLATTPGGPVSTRIGTPSTANRIGITASRKVGGAVVRNRFKRRIREWFRYRRHDLGENRDFVVIARRSGAVLNLAELDRSLSTLLKVDPLPLFQAPSAGIRHPAADSSVRPSSSSYGSRS